MKKIKKYWVIIFATIVILTLTNPTNADLKSFLSSNGFYGTGGRVSYFGVFSIFKADVGWQFKNPQRIYIGFFKNFICISKKE